MAENLLTVSALRTTVEAELIRGKLEAAGIPAVLVEPEPAGEGATAGRVQVQVSQPDFERAMQLLFPIPKINPVARPAHPAWKCPHCGEQVMGSFPRCWSCGTPREGAAADGTPPSEGSFPALPAMPAAPLPPMPPGPKMPPSTPLPALPSTPLAGLPSAPRLEMPPRITMPGEGAASVASAMPNLTVPPLAAESPAGTEASPAVSKPAMNGDSSIKGLSLPPRSLTRTAAEDGLEIVVPAWDPNTAKAGRGSRAANRRSPTEADDRAARRAWWTAVFGIPCPPLLIYSIGVILILGFSNRPLSARGNRFFYGALTLNALIIAVVFAICGMLR